MRMLFGVVAEGVSETREGKLNIFGEFSAIWSPKVPFTIPSLFLFARFEAQITEGAEHSATVALIDEDGREVMPQSPPIEFRFVPTGPGHPLRTQLIAHFSPLRLPRWGGYEFHLLIDGRHMGSVPFRVQRAELKKDEPS